MNQALRPIVTKMRPITHRCPTGTCVAILPPAPPALHARLSDKIKAA